MGPGDLAIQPIAVGSKTGGGSGRDENGPALHDRRERMLGQKAEVEEGVQLRGSIGAGSAVVVELHSLLA